MLQYELIFVRNACLLCSYHAPVGGGMCKNLVDSKKQSVPIALLGLQHTRVRWSSKLNWNFLFPNMVILHHKWYSSNCGQYALCGDQSKLIYDQFSSYLKTKNCGHASRHHTPVFLNRDRFGIESPGFTAKLVTNELPIRI